ncbi:DUF1523 family protein [Poseidonocella pacifica]|uniref:DUF1523 family protein n=1 Tax=Poseidonocella pacifica TaxID=871651 RepID=UPI003CCC397C
MKWILLAIVAILVASVVHYTLPQTDIVRITDTYEKRVDVGENRLFWSNASSGFSTSQPGRDVFFIQTRRDDGDVMVYRNEDTGWGWPPFFKFNTSNLQAEANDLRSTGEAPQWVRLRHYGWRNEMFSIFPNALSVEPIASPAEGKGWPIGTIVVLTLLVAAIWAVTVRIRRFFARRRARREA